MQAVNPGTSNAYRLAYESIRNLILSGELMGGIKLVEERLAEKIGVSRTPIREAIRHLEQEGLIKNKRVYKPTKEDLIYSSELITLIESHAAKKAAENMSREKLSQLKHAMKESRKGTVDEIVSANKKFHNLIISECNNPVMVEELQ
ncbi:MAG TPA: GntR family transcriptional regulator, partial [Ureibacillus sp.]|nr:GntR family transcriptional regulator [Ureibacillus sp.]